MSKNNKQNNEPTMVRIRKTAKLDPIKLLRVARKFCIPPISVREIRLGYSENIPLAAAVALESDGFVTRVRTKCRTQQERVDDLVQSNRSSNANVSETVETLVDNGGTNSDETNENEVV